MRTSRLAGFVLVALVVTTGRHSLVAAGQQPAPIGHAASPSGARLKSPAPPPVMSPVKWLPDPVESKLRSASIPLQCTETQVAPVRNMPAHLPYLLDCWLEFNPNVASAIRWDVGGQLLVAWTAWPEERKAALRDAFRNAMLWHANGLVDYQGPTFNEPIENQEAPFFAQQPIVRTALDEDTQAWPLYVATTGHILAAEIFGYVPWTIRDMSQESLTALLSGAGPGDYAQFYRDFNDGTYYDTIYPGFGVWGESTPAHPAYTYKFLVDNNLIGATQTETIERVLDWARWNLWHFGGNYTWDNVFHTWGYYGDVPVARVIEGTVLTHPYYQQSDHPWGKEPHHWTAGCYGTSRFLVNVLRLANIPVKFLQEDKNDVPLGGHSTAHFLTIGRYMSHGDDPYSALSRGFEPFPARQLLIDQTMMNDWFVNANLQTRLKNVDRRPGELSIFFPTQSMLDSYCSDQANGKSHADGLVAAYYMKWFTLSELESMLTWQRLDKAIQQHGCVM
jgi:hypothetical protein